MFKNCFWRTVLKNIFKQALSFHPKTQYLQFYPKPRFYLRPSPSNLIPIAVLPRYIALISSHPLGLVHTICLHVSPFVSFLFLPVTLPSLHILQIWLFHSILVTTSMTSFVFQQIEVTLGSQKISQIQDQGCPWTTQSTALSRITGLMCVTP